MLISDQGERGEERIYKKRYPFDYEPTGLLVISTGIKLKKS
jgi:hypothetical protein